MQDKKLDILQQGHRWVVINKPAGIATEKHYDHDTVEARAQVQWKRPRSEKRPYVGIVHRLDRPVSGALLLAQNKSTLVALNTAFAERKTEKVYWALTAAALPKASGRLKHYLARDKFGRKAIASNRPLPSAKESVLDYQLLGQIGKNNLYEVRPITGRFHQIRVQLAAAGAPIIGDEPYGSEQVVGPNIILLHARSLTFPDPSGEPVAVVAPLPAHWPTVSFEEE